MKRETFVGLTCLAYQLPSKHLSSAPTAEESSTIVRKRPGPSMQPEAQENLMEFVATQLLKGRKVPRLAVDTLQLDGRRDQMPWYVIIT